VSRSWLVARVRFLLALVAVLLMENIEFCHSNPITNRAVLAVRQRFILALCTE
jgi:hypothetical protein